MAKVVHLVDNTVRIETVDLDGGTLSSGLTGPISNYDAYPGDGSWAAAPDSGSEDVYTPPFKPSNFSVSCRSFAVEIRVAFDSVPTYLDWIVLEPGVHGFDGWGITSLQIREDVNGAGAEYQIVAEA